MELLRCLMFINTVSSTGLSPRSIQNAEIKAWKRHSIAPKIATSITKFKYESKKSHGLVMHKRKRFVKILKSLSDNKLFTCEDTLNKFSDLNPAASILKQGLSMFLCSGLSLSHNNLKKLVFPDTIDDKNFHFYRYFHLRGLITYNEQYLPYPDLVSKFHRLMQDIIRSVILDRLLKNKFDKSHYQISDITSEISKELKVLALEIEDKIYKKPFLLENILVEHLTNEFRKMVQEKIDFLDEKFLKLTDAPESVKITNTEKYCSKVFMQKFNLCFSFIRLIFQMSVYFENFQKADLIYNSVDLRARLLDIAVSIYLIYIDLHRENFRGIEKLLSTPNIKLWKNAKKDTTDKIARDLDSISDKLLRHIEQQIPTIEIDLQHKPRIQSLKLLTGKVLSKERLFRIFNQMKSKIKNTKSSMNSFGGQGITIFRRQNNAKLEKHSNLISGIERMRSHMSSLHRSIKPDIKNLHGRNNEDIVDDLPLKEESSEMKDLDDLSSDEECFYSSEDDQALSKNVENACYRARLEKNLLKSQSQTSPKSSSFLFNTILISILLFLAMLRVIFTI